MEVNYPVSVRSIHGAPTKEVPVLSHSFRGSGSDSMLRHVYLHTSQSSQRSVLTGPCGDDTMSIIGGKLFSTYCNFER